MGGRVQVRPVSLPVAPCWDHLLIIAQFQGEHLVSLERGRIHLQFIEPWNQGRPMELGRTHGPRRARETQDN